MRNNKVILFIFSLILFFISCNNVYSKAYVTITADDIVVRTGASTKNEKYGNIYKNSIYYLEKNEIVADEGKNGMCDEGWYNITYNNKSGFICSRFAEATVMVADQACEEELKNQGFPSDYVTSLCELKSVHKDWSFIPIKTNIEWKTAVEKESSCGKSYIYNGDPDQIDTSCKSQYGDSSPWKPASQKAVAYYMDPRNWLTEQHIFQFNTNKYENSLSNAYVQLSTNTIKGANFYTYHLSIGNDLATIINQAGYETNVSPIFLSSRMIQELGSGTAEYNLYSGVTTDWENLYNFFNIGVSDACANTYGVTYCGLNYAKTNEWTTPLAAIKGGSQIVSEGYINAGQYTTYLQKYNVVPNKASNLFLHQYMTNVAAPASESKTAYNTYKTVGVLDSPFVFYIPVYNNMEGNINNNPNGATGGSTSTNTTASSIPTIVTSAGYKFASNNITGIKVGTSIENIISTLESVAGTNNVVIKKSDGTEIKSGIIATGYKVYIKNNEGITGLGVIIKGDTSGDGIINALDLLQVQKSILGTYQMTDEYRLAGDTSGDGIINALDLLQVQKNILGTYIIEQ